MVIFLVMVMSMPVSAATILHYDFEDGTPGVPMNDFPVTQQNGTIGSYDLSGNGYHMHSWDDYWGPLFSSEGDTPTGVGLSIVHEGHRDGYTLAGGIRAWSPSTWTIELSFKLYVVDGWKTLIGRDEWTGIDGDIGPARQVQSNGVGGGDPRNNAMRVAFATVSGEHYELYSSLIPVPGKWYHLAVVTDGDQLDMYADELDGNGYQNIGTLMMTPGGDHSLRATGNWTFGRGWYNGGFVDHIDGNMDDIRFSDVALSPAQFLHSPSAYDPIPAHNAPNVSTSLDTLSWTNPNGVDVCEVYFGKNTGEPNSVSYKTMLTLIETIENPSKQSSVSFTETLAEGDVCYWVVDCYKGSAPPEDPNLPGAIWKFTVNDNDTPVVDAGDDQGLWLGMNGDGGEVTVILDGSVTDDGLPNPPGETVIQWTLVSGPETEIDANDMELAWVTLTETGTYVFNLWASDGEFEEDDSVTVYVGNDACGTSHMMPEAGAYHAFDFNQDCIVDMRDFAEVAAAWLDCTDILTDCD